MLFIISIIGILSLLVYLKYYISYELYEGGIILFKTGILLAAVFPVVGILLLLYMRRFFKQGDTVEEYCR